MPHRLYCRDSAAGQRSEKTSLISVRQKRERWIEPGDAPIWVDAGRWGPRRVRVSECSALKAEDVYSAIVREQAEIGPGAQGRVIWNSGDVAVIADWEILSNSIWRNGRVFFRCGRCGLRATRLYLPDVPDPARLFACRRCLGLSYESQTTHQYRDWIPRGLSLLPFTHREIAYQMSFGERERRRTACRERQGERRRLRKGR